MIIFDLVRHRCSNDPQENGRLRLIVKISWAIETISSSLAVLVTVLYWCMVHQIVIKYSLLIDESDWVFTFFFHASNTMLSVIDLMVSARPVSLYHGYLPVIFGFCYSLFSLLYWLCGGHTLTI